MRINLSPFLVLVVAACVADVDKTSEVTSDVRINPARDATEAVFVNGRRCTMVFPGGLTPQTQTYVIWPVGTHGIVNAPYNTPRRPNLYAVFANGPLVDQQDIHHVDGFEAFDHSHIAENPPCDDDVENTKWDVLGLFPGPNFNAATYRPARSVRAMLAQPAAGILGPVQTLPEAGFPELVLFAPVNCPEQ